MRIKTTTTREIKDSDYWSWADSMRDQLNAGLRQEKIDMIKKGIILQADELTNADFMRLKNEGKLILRENYGYTEAVTMFEIINK